MWSGILAAGLLLCAFAHDSLSVGLVTQSGPRAAPTAPPSDTTPDNFSFTDQSSVALSSTITSAAITVSGINAASTITVSGGTYDVNSSGSFTSSSGSVSNGNTVRARHTSSASNSTATNTVVTIGGVSDTFTSTTLAAASGNDILDDFEGTMRTLGGHNLWDVYTSEGANATTSFSTSAKRFGSKGLLYHGTGGTGVYMHFFSNDGSTWAFMHEKVLSGTWTQNKYNRKSFWVYHPSGFNPPSDNSHMIEYGNYTRKKLGDAATQNDGGNHFYHYFNPRAGVWTKVIVDPHPQHSVGGGTSDPGVQTSPTSDGTGWNYFDSETRWYWNAPYNNLTGDIYFDDVELYFESRTEDITSIASLEASYNGSTDLLHVGFARSTTEDPTFNAVYSTSGSILDNGWGSGTTFGSVGPDGNGDYVNKKIEATIDLGAATEVWIGVRKGSGPTMREIKLELN